MQKAKEILQGYVAQAEKILIELNFNEDMVDSEHIQIWIEGIPETIIEKLEMTLEEINRHVSY